MFKFRPALALAIVGMAAACAAPEPVAEREIRPQPTFDKFGGGSCEEGYVYIPGTAPMPPECIPDDECDDIVLADGSTVEDCPEPERERDPSLDRSDSEDRGSSTDRDPTGAPSVPGTAPRG